MGKQTNLEVKDNYDAVESFDDLDDDEFFERYSPKKTHRKARKTRDARRRIENYREDRELQRRLSELYFETDD